MGATESAIVSQTYNAAHESLIESIRTILQERQKESFVNCYR